MRNYNCEFLSAEIFGGREFLAVPGIFGDFWRIWGFLAVGGFWGFWRKSGFEGGIDVGTLMLEL